MSDTKDETQGVDDSNEEQGGRSRAKNQTVMLSPELTGQVRAMLNNDPSGSSNPLTDLLGQTPDNAWDKPTGDSSASSMVSDAGELLSSTPEAVSGFEEEQPLPAPSYEAQAPVYQEPSYQPPAPASPPILASHPAPAAPAPAPVYAAPVEFDDFITVVQNDPSKLVGFLVCFDHDENGSICPLRVGRWMLTSKSSVDDTGMIVVNDQSISPLHAIIRVTEAGSVQVLDQLSEQGTGIMREDEDEEQEVSGSLVEVDHGDVLRFGNLHFTVCMVPFYEE